MTSAQDRHHPPTARPLRVACIGGGPGGLFTAIALSHSMPDATIDVFERNHESDVFGFGVVFSDATLENVDAVDPVLRETLDAHGTHWDTISVRTASTTMSAGGNGMSAVHRRVLLDAMRKRACDRGARLHFATEVTVDELDARGDYDLIVAADGTNSSVRQRFPDELGHTVDEATRQVHLVRHHIQFDGLTFLHKQSEHGNFAVHGYPIGSGLSTFIVETDEATWRRAGLDAFDVTSPPGQSDVRDSALPRDAVRRSDRRPQARRQQLAVGQLSHPPHADGGTPAPKTAPPSSFSATPCTPRTSRSVRAPRWRWKTPRCWRRPSRRTQAISRQRWASSS